MSYIIEAHETVEDALRRIALEQTARIIEELDTSSLDAFFTAHETRKRCKKIRGLLRIVRPEVGKIYKIENSWYRDASRLLSDMRDAEAMIETYDTLMARFSNEVNRRAFGRIRGALTRDKNALAADCNTANELFQEFRQRIIIGRERIPDWSLDKNGFDALSGGLAKTFDRARSAMKKAQAKPTDKNLHDWRKRVKYHWYHMRLLRRIWPAEMRAREKGTKEITDLLGDDHNLAVLSDRLRGNPSHYAPSDIAEAFLALAAQRRTEAQQEAFEMGHKIFAEKTDDFVTRCRSYWEAWAKGN